MKRNDVGRLSRLTEEQDKQRDGLMAAALMKLMRDDFQGFWDGLEKVNSFVTEALEE